jgi:hypothetical protein
MLVCRAQCHPLGRAHAQGLRATQSTVRVSLPNPHNDRCHPCDQIEMALDHVTGHNGIGEAYLALTERGPEAPP